MKKSLESLLTNNTYKQVLKLLDEKKILDNFDTLKEISKNKNQTNKFESFIFREAFIEKIGYVLLSHELINALAKHLKNKKCLEVMAGCGSISKCLKDKGIDIIPTDNYSWKDRKWFSDNKWCNIENLDCIIAIQKYKQDIDYIIMSWPPYDSPEANNVLLEVQKINKELNKDIKIIYIGEEKSGCNADDDFFDNIININYLPDINKYFYRAYGIYDSVYEIY